MEKSSTIPLKSTTKDHQKKLHLERKEKGK